MIIIKEFFSSKFLKKSNQFNFYKENYEEIKKENISLKEKNNTLNQKNSYLLNKVDSYSKLFEDFKNIYISNIQNSSNYVSDSKKILFVLHSGSGGTPKTVNDIVKNIYKFFDCYLLTSDTHIMKLQFFNGKKFEILETVDLFSKWNIENCYIEEYSNIYFKFLIKYNFDIVHIHHLIFHTFDLPKLCNDLQIPVILSLHDLYFICPAYTLLDGDFKYCGGQCSNSISNKNCFMPMNNITKIDCMKNFVGEWRKLVSEIFSYMDILISPSLFIKDIFNEYYSLENKQLEIIEHGIDYDKSKQQLFEVPDENNPTKILFLGNLYPQKGLNVIKDLFKIDIEKNLELHFLGHAPNELSEIGISHGEYDYEDLYDHIKEIKPSFIGIFTLCGESYCYTLSEAWSFGIPVLVSELGALKERVLKNGGGWLIEISNVQNIYDTIISIVRNPNEYMVKQNEINDIVLISTKSMSKKYLEIYNNLI